MTDEEYQKHVDKALELINATTGSKEDKNFLRGALKAYCEIYESKKSKQDKSS